MQGAEAVRRPVSRAQLTSHMLAVGRVAVGAGHEAAANSVAVYSPVVTVTGLARLF